MTVSIPDLIDILEISCPQDVGKYEYILKIQKGTGTSYSVRSANRAPMACVIFNVLRRYDSI
jgi:hypothetical protein